MRSRSSPLRRGRREESKTWWFFLAACALVAAQLEAAPAQLEAAPANATVPTVAAVASAPSALLLSVVVRPHKARAASREFELAAVLGGDLALGLGQRSPHLPERAHNEQKRMLISVILDHFLINLILPLA